MSFHVPCWRSKTHPSPPALPLLEGKCLVEVGKERLDNIYFSRYNIVITQEQYSLLPPLLETVLPLQCFPSGQAPLPLLMSNR